MKKHQESEEKTMQEAQRTPGPWTIEDENGDGAEIVNREHDGENWDIATVYDPANARLIATAPELLEFAQEMASSIAVLGIPNDVTKHIAEKALALVTKASRRAV